FRRRGELERAIRVHQNLLQRPDLPENQRDQALHELAQDYLKAGMLDRAEDAFERLKSTRFAADALRALLRIYEVEHDWPRAIATVQALQSLVDEPVPMAVHYHCELAAAALAATPPDLAAAHTALDAASNQLESHARHEGSQPGLDAGPVRVSLLRAELASREGDRRSESVLLASVVKNYPLYAGMAASRLIASLGDASAEKAETLQYLRKVYEQCPTQDLFDV